MGAEHAIRRERTAREVAAQLKVSPRTVRRVIAQPRQEYLSEAKTRHELIRQLRANGLTMRAIAAEVECSVGTVYNALKDVPHDA